MKEMTSRERFSSMFEHRPADRIPITDIPWKATLVRWEKKGLPKDVSWIDYFGIDCVENIWVDNSSRYPEQTIGVTDQYKIYTTKWGATQKEWLWQNSTPEFLNFTIVDPESW
ncbi:MAG: hypothetical protein WC703_04880 [Candidatus Neomarinimicrobiota bacterium]